jgi:hypothetical protein
MVLAFMRHYLPLTNAATRMARREPGKHVMFKKFVHLTGVTLVGNQLSKNLLTTIIGFINLIFLALMTFG